MLGIEGERLGLGRTSLQIEPDEAELTGLFFDGGHEGRCDAGSTQVRADPESFDLADRRRRVTDRSDTDATGEMSFGPRHEEGAGRWAKLFRVIRHIVLDRSVAAVEFVDRRVEDAARTVRIESLGGDGK